jgi:PHP family Zn ribbon phosphoesterase
MDYSSIVRAIREKNPVHLIGTLETDSRYGKYFWDGHRKCSISLSPAETRKRKYICPVCKTKVTIGVAHRIETLAQRPEGWRPAASIPFQTILPLEEIVAHAMDREKNSKAVENEYEQLIQKLGPELKILLDVTESDLHLAAPPLIAEAILALRGKNYSVKPGYDGVWGKPEMISADRRLVFTRPQMEMF